MFFYFLFFNNGDGVAGAVPVVECTVADAKDAQCAVIKGGVGSLVGERLNGDFVAADSDQRQAAYFAAMDDSPGEDAVNARLLSRHSRDVEQCGVGDDSPKWEYIGGDVSSRRCPPPRGDCPPESPRASPKWTEPRE